MTQHGFKKGDLVLGYRSGMTYELIRKRSDTTHRVVWHGKVVSVPRDNTRFRIGSILDVSEDVISLVTNDIKVEEKVRETAWI